MALSAISSVTARRPAQPTAPKQLVENKNTSNGNAPDSIAPPTNTPFPQFRSMSLDDVLSRQQSSPDTMQHAGQTNRVSGSTGSVSAAAADRISQPFIDAFSAAATNPQVFDDMLESTFGDNIDQGQAEQFRQSALEGDFSFLPDVEYVKASALHGNNGAYGAETNTIYINQDLKGTELGAQTFIEEAGHFLDNRLNTSDTRGDEGDLFRRILSGESLSSEAIAEIRAEDDSGTINVDGTEIEVEFAFSFSSIGSAISSAASSFGSSVSNVASSAGNAISNAASSFGSSVSNVASSAGNAISNAASNVVSGASNVLSYAGNAVSSAGNTVGSAISSSADFATNTVNGVFETAGNVISNVAEGAGNLITGAANIVDNVVSGAGNFLGEKLDQAGQALAASDYNILSSAGNVLSSAGNGLSNWSNTVGGWISGGVSWVNDNVLQPIVNTSIELVQDIVPIVTGIASWPLHVAGNAVSGLGDTFGALLNGKFDEAWSSFSDTIVDTFVAKPAELLVTTLALGANTAVNAINNLFSLSEERGLTQREVKYLREIFGDSIDYSSITIQTGGIKELLGISPQTTGMDIFLRPQFGSQMIDANGVLTQAGLQLLGHEATHVWQNQHGGITYAGDALITQGLDHFGSGDGYDFTAALADGVAFEDMNPEQQGTVAEFIGVAINDNTNNELTQVDFESAAGLPELSLSVAQFAIVQAAHVSLRR